MIAMHLFSDTVYMIGGFVVFLLFLVVIVMAASGSSPKKRTGKDDRDEITCAGFSQMIDNDD